jgi:tripartite-type tricarboxylate transporter receptor subunit TctC
MASTGVGTAPHLAGELFNMMASVKLFHIPYRSNFIPDLVGGQVQVSFPGVLSIAGYVTNGQLRALGVTGAKRSAAYSDIPAIGEFVSGYEMTTWYGIGAPKDTPVAIVDKINAAVAAAIADPDTKARLDKLGFETQSMTPAEFAGLIAAETEKWRKVVKFAGIKLD